MELAVLCAIDWRVQAGASAPEFLDRLLHVANVGRDASGQLLQPQVVHAARSTAKSLIAAALHGARKLAACSRMFGLQCMLCACVAVVRTAPRSRNVWVYISHVSIQFRLMVCTICCRRAVHDECCHLARPALQCCWGSTSTATRQQHGQHMPACRNTCRR